MGPNFRAFSGSVVTISGGTFGPTFNAFSGSDAELIGGEFRLNGADFTGVTITFPLPLKLRRFLQVHWQTGLLLSLVI